MVSEASGGKPTGTEGPAAVAVGPKPGDPAGSRLTEQDGKLLALLDQGLTPGKIAMRLRVDTEWVRQRSRVLTGQLTACPDLNATQEQREGRE